jgi:serine/threonine protein kinase
MLQTGDEINKYRISKEINIGGFCNSYFANDASGTYFLKEYLEPKETDPRFMAFFQNQQTIIERLNAMGSIAEKYVDHFVENSTYYQVKEKLNGINLMDYLLTHGEFQQRKDLCVILCGIVKSLHNEGIVHQDLKPQQLMLVDDVIGKKTKIGYRFVLSDFDWSIPDGKVAEIVGTIYYKSPEHYRNQIPTVQSDIFTVGVMIFELLTGKNPFDFDDFADDITIGKRVLSAKSCNKPHALNNEISLVLSDLIIQCLNPDPSQRPDLETIQLSLIGAELAGENPLVLNKLKRISLNSGGQKMIIYGNKELTRQDLKIFFNGLTDKDGNSVHKYCEEGIIMLQFEMTPAGQFTVFSPVITKNHFLLQGTKIGLSPVSLSSGDQLSLFSMAKDEIICSWTIDK